MRGTIVSTRVASVCRWRVRSWSYFKKQTDLGRYRGTRPNWPQANVTIFSSTAFLHALQQTPGYL